ncbi:MAG: hypothetical protein ACR2JF_13955 [Iamia sp.]
MRAPARLAVTGAILVGSVLGACTDEGSSQDFCDRVGDVPPLGQVLAQLDTSDPGGARRQLDEAVSEFKALEADSPGAIRSDVARLREGVELVVEAVEDNPDDLPAARDAITQRSDELSGLAQAGAAVVDYADAECGIALDGLGGEAPASTLAPTTEAGG